MDFEVTVLTIVPNEIVGETNSVRKQTFEQFYDALEFIEHQMAAWNNFNPQYDLDVSIRKVPSNTPTLGVVANDEMNLADRMGN